TKEGNSIATEPSTITLTGFSSLQKAVKAILFTDEMVDDGNGTMVMKNVLNLGSAGFHTLSELNDNSSSMTSIASENTEAATVSSSSGEIHTRSASLSLRDASESTAGNQSGSSVSVKDNLNNKLSHKITGDVETKLNGLKAKYSTFEPSDLYLTGAAKLIS
ncbi:hypothetical protein LNO75_03920, partial [Mycoplasma sp. T363T]|uniref:hypothetical protein n=1 Tax=Mycoplasma bradburyae TaxID=2963128 RepID=UPI002340C9B2